MSETIGGEGDEGSSHLSENKVSYLVVNESAL